MHPDENPNDTAEAGVARTDRLRRRFAEKAAPNHPRLLASSFERWRQAEGWDRDRLAETLGTDGAGLDRLYLCRAPREDQFRKDVAELASHTGADVARLRTALRRIQVMATFAEAEANNREVAGAGLDPEGSADSRPGRAWAGRLLVAARDREDQDGDEVAGEPQGEEEDAGDR